MKVTRVEVVRNKEPIPLTPATTQALIREPILVGADGCVPIPDKPGLGIELEESKLA